MLVDVGAGGEKPPATRLGIFSFIYWLQSIYKETLISNVYNDFIDIELKEKESINTMIYNLESCSFDDFVNDVNIDFDELDKLMELKMNKLRRKFA